MKFLTDTGGEIDVNIHEMTMEIDMVFHNRITNLTGVTMSHYLIQDFITDFIKWNNKRTSEILLEEKRIDELVRSHEKICQKKIKAGRTIENLDGIMNKFRFYVLDYILIEE